MPGLIEDDDPGESSLGSHLTFTSSTVDAVPMPDVEFFVDRLRFMGLDHALVDEADRRLRADLPAGMRWLREQLKALDPPRKPPACDCGEPLVDTDWRGRATIRCSVCGSRWGVEVIDEGTESLWSISGPTAEWRHAHPVEENDPYGEFQPDAVLRDGLPPLPATEIHPGTSFPVATWQGDRHAAVLYVHRQEAGEFDMPGDEYEDETEHLALDEGGEWTSTGSGGGNWVDVFDPPVELLEKYVVLGTGISGTGTGDDAISFTGGLCSQAVASVQTIDGDGTQTYRIDPERPFFVVGVHGPGQVRILDENGRVLHGPTGSPLQYGLND